MPLMDQALHDYIFKLGNPYAKLSIPEALEQPKLWKTSAEFFGFLANCFSTAQFGANPPATFKKLAAEAVLLHGRAQRFVESRLRALMPPTQMVFNRLGAADQKALAKKFAEIFEEAKTLDASEE